MFALPSRACSTRWRSELGLDPFALRRANYLSAPTFTDNDLMVNSYGLPRMPRLGRAGERLEGAQGQAADSGKGLGFACSHYISGASKPVNWTGEPHATVKLKLDFDGSIVLLTGAADIGQGSSTILVQTVAEVLGLDLCAHPHRHRRQRRGAEGQRLLFLARHLHGRQCRHRCGQQSQGGADRGGGAQARSQARGDRMPGRTLSRRRAGQGPDLRARWSPRR